MIASAGHDFGELPINPPEPGHYEKVADGLIESISNNVGWDADGDRHGVYIRVPILVPIEDCEVADVNQALEIAIQELEQAAAMLRRAKDL